MKHGSLFSGIGGFDLAAEWMGWENSFHCEWNEFGQKILKYYWPKAESFTDITKTNFKKYEKKIDIITGGFPCQPYSSAGKRRGKEDIRHLWPEMLRAIREIQPSWIVGENVRGLTNWNGGLVFDEVQADLEAEGYEVLPFLLPACAVNAPHRRDRIWFIAYTKNNGYSRKFEQREGMQNNKRNICKCKKKGWDEIRAKFERCNEIRTITNTDNNGLQRRICAEQNNQQRWDKSRFVAKNFTDKNGSIPSAKWENFPTVAAICDGDDGLSNRLDNITFSKWRKESIKAGGNAIVPQVAFEIFKSIENYNKLNDL